MLISLNFKYDNLSCFRKKLHLCTAIKKFSISKFGVTLDYEEELQRKMLAFEVSKMHKPTQSTQLVLVTTFGLVHGAHSGMVHRTVTLKDLFLLSLEVVES